jgi:hypothetical protein
MTMASKKTAEPTEPQTFDEPPRRLEDVTIDSRTLTDKSLTVTWSNGWSYLIPNRALEKHFPVGAHVTVETIRFTQVTGLKVAGEWVWRESDQERKAKEQVNAERIAADEAARLEDNRDDWTARTAALPDWLRERLQRLVDHEETGDQFQREWWSYELGSSELAALYAEHPAGDDAPEVKAYAAKHGTTGLQHGWAAAAARQHAQEVAEAAQAAAEATVSPKG